MRDDEIRVESRMMKGEQPRVDALSGDRFVSFLVQRLLDAPVMFVIGAGFSKNWGFPLGWELAEWLGRRYEQLRSLEEPDVKAVLEDDGRKKDLSLVAEVLARNKCWFIRKVFWDPESPPCAHFYDTAEELGEGDPLADGRLGEPHIVIGRLAKEGLIQEIITTNYDCLLEAGCYAVGMYEAQGERTGNITASVFPWTESYRVYSSREDAVELVPRRAVFRIYKIHGCVASLKRRVQEDECADKCPPHEYSREMVGSKCYLGQDRFNLVITYRELLDWRQDRWARDLFLDRVRTHHLVFLGMQGADSVLHASLRSIFEEVWGADRSGVVVNTSEYGKSPVGSGSCLPGRRGEPAMPEVAAGQCQRPEEHESALRDYRSDIRAQASERDVSPILRQILRTAAYGRLDEEIQIYDVNHDSRARFVRLFREVYVGAMRKLLEQRLRLRGPGWVERILAREENGQQTKDGQGVTDLVRESLLRRSHRICGKLASDVVKDLPEKLWYHALPTAVLISWLLREPALSQGDSSLLQRVRRPHYYVPLSCVEELTFPLLAAYYGLIAKLGSSQSACLQDGWVLMPPRYVKGLRQLVRPLVFPVVLPPDHYLARRLHLPRPEVCPPISLARQACVQPTLLLIIKAGEASRNVRVNPAVVPGAGSGLHVNQLTYHVVPECDLIGDDLSVGWVDGLYEFTI